MSVIDWILRHALWVGTVVATVTIVVVGPIVVAPLASRRLRREEDRLEELEAWATAWRWTFDRAGSETETGRRLKECVIAARPLSTLSDVDSGRVGVLLTGIHAGRPTTAAVYTCTVTMDTFVGADPFAVIVVQIWKPSPTVRVMARWIGSRLWRTVAGWLRPRTWGYELDRRFRVSVNEAAVADQLLGPQLAELLFDCAPTLLDLRSQNLVLVWRGGVDVTNLAARIEAASSIAEFIERAAPS